MSVTFWSRAIGAAVFAALLLGAASLAIAPTAAHADNLDTTTAFTTTSPVEAAFGGPWVLTVQVNTNQYPLTLMPSSGTVDVYIEGSPGAYVTGVPLSPGGVAYVAQPENHPLLGSGTFSVTAEFVPASGEGVNGSRTATPATLVIAPLAVTAAAVITADPAVSASPVISASLTGPYVSAREGAPAGEWSFSVTDEDGEETFSAVIAQAEGAKEAILVSVDTQLARGTTYTLTSTFTPADSLAAGLTVTQPEDSQVRTAEGTAADLLVTPVPMRPWLIAILSAVFVVLVLAIILLPTRIALRRAVVAGHATDIAGDPSGGPQPSALEPASKD